MIANNLNVYLRQVKVILHDLSGDFHVERVDQQLHSLESFESDCSRKLRKAHRQACRLRRQLKAQLKNKNSIKVQELYKQVLQCEMKLEPRFQRVKGVAFVKYNSAFKELAYEAMIVNVTMKTLEEFFKKAHSFAIKTMKKVLTQSATKRFKAHTLSCGFRKRKR